MAASNPAAITCTADTWVKVANSVESGVIHRTSVAPNVYKKTFKIAGQAAPTDDDEAVLVFGSSNEDIISSESVIDVYIKAVRVAGEVVVDL